MRYLLIVLAMVFAVSLLLSCGRRDDRNDIRAQYGEPNAIRRTGVDPFWSETWFYSRAGIAFEFRRTSGCGTPRDVYLYVSYPIAVDTTGASQPKANAQPGAQQHFEKILSPVAPR